MGVRMDIQKIKQLIDLLAHSDLSEIELVEGEHKLRLVKRVAHASANFSGTPGADPGVPASDGMALQPAGGTAKPAGPAPPSAAPLRAALVASPIHGVLHLTPAPNEPAYVAQGDRFQAGQTLCMVEAMKMFHEVKAERAGEVLAILADSGEEVEAGQALFQVAQAPWPA
jgi:acetyl-CoA carboxylase biotin carboxyl carrier protein